MIKIILPVILCSIFISSISIAKSKDSTTSAKSHRNEVNLVLTLDKVILIKTASRFKDELYMNVTEFSNMDKPKYRRIPSYPSHWLSNYISKVHDIRLWEKKVKDGETIELKLSFVEEEFSPWEIDDLLGALTLKISNNHGRISKEWIIPNNKYTLKEGHPNTFELKGEGGDYKLVIHLHRAEHTTMRGH